MKNRRDRLFIAMFHGLAVVLLATAAPASAQAASEARGIVYLDRNENRARDRGEPGIAGVKVSNGRDVVKTDREGRYAISLPPESILFLSKPARYRVPLDEVNLPQFYYIHYPNGTPAIVSWRWPVIEPTGPLPAAIDFALLPGETNDKFNALAFADPQTADDEDLDMMRKDIVDPLVGNPHGALFGVVAGDVMNDNLSLYERHNRLMAMIGVPMWNVPGNHDLNYQSPNNDYATETFKSVFGPDYYSFDYGRVHVLALNNVDWRGSSAGYRGFLHPKQLEWIRNDLADVPRDRLILIVTHIPLVTNALDENGERYAMGEDINTVNFAELLELLKPFKYVYGIAGHDTSNSWKVEVNHTHGWHGYPFTAHTLAEARGSGWSLGPRDDRGVRPATMADGNPNGYYVLSFDGTKVVPRFVPAHTPAGQRMRVTLDPPLIVPGDARDAQLDRGMQPAGMKAVVNLYDGGERDRITVSLDGGAPVPLTNVLRTDPFMERVFKQYAGTSDAFARPAPSSHIWEFDLPLLEPGAHRLQFEAVDQFGQTAREAFTFEVTPPPTP
jgi:hypothetical protein